MLANEKLIPKSRLAPAAGISRQFVDRVITELTESGQIAPERTATGRELLSYTELEVIWPRLRER